MNEIFVETNDCLQYKNNQTSYRQNLKVQDQLTSSVLSNCVQYSHKNDFCVFVASYDCKIGPNFVYLFPNTNKGDQDENLTTKNSIGSNLPDMPLNTSKLEKLLSDRYLLSPILYRSPNNFCDFEDAGFKNYVTKDKILKTKKLGQKISLQNLVMRYRDLIADLCFPDQIQKSNVKLIQLSFPTYEGYLHGVGCYLIELSDSNSSIKFEGRQLTVFFLSKIPNWELLYNTAMYFYNSVNLDSFRFFDSFVEKAYHFLMNQLTRNRIINKTQVLSNFYWEPIAEKVIEQFLDDIDCRSILILLKSIFLKYRIIIYSKCQFYAAQLICYLLSICAEYSDWDSIVDENFIVSLSINRDFVDNNTAYKMIGFIFVANNKFILKKLDYDFIFDLEEKKIQWNVNANRAKLDLLDNEVEFFSSFKSIICNHFNDKHIDIIQINMQIAEFSKEYSVPECIIYNLIEFCLTEIRKYCFLSSQTIYKLYLGIIALILSNVYVSRSSINSQYLCLRKTPFFNQILSQNYSLIYLNSNAYVATIKKFGSLLMLKKPPEFGFGTVKINENHLINGFFYEFGLIGWGWEKIFSSELYYCGSWYKNAYHGLGCLHNKAKNVMYVGSFVSNIKNGYGEMLTNDKCYWGQFESNQFNNEGILLDFQKNCRFEGEFSMGEPSGICKALKLSDDTFEVEYLVCGEWLGGEMNGEGYYIDNHCFYKGGFHNNKFHGFGVVLYSDMNYFIGYFENGNKKHGAFILKHNADKSKNPKISNLLNNENEETCFPLYDCFLFHNTEIQKNDLISFLSSNVSIDSNRFEILKENYPTKITIPTLVNIKNGEKPKKIIKDIDDFEKEFVDLNITSQDVIFFGNWDNKLDADWKVIHDNWFYVGKLKHLKQNLLGFNGNSIINDHEIELNGYWEEGSAKKLSVNEKKLKFLDNSRLNNDFKAIDNFTKKYRSIFNVGFFFF